MDMSAAYSMNTSENAFGDGNGYSAGPLVGATPATPATASTARRGSGLDVNHHFALIVAAGALILYMTHHLGFRGVVAR